MNRGWDQNQGGSRVEGNRYLLLMTPVTSALRLLLSVKQATHNASLLSIFMMTAKHTKAGCLQLQDVSKPQGGSISP